MRKFIFISITLVSCQIAFGQKAAVVKFDRLQKIIDTKSGGIQIINFWATWCAPCVKELPLFELLQAENPDIKVTLVNLDFADKVEKVNAFIARKKMKAETLLLDEVDYNTWIDKVDASWSGAIPATLIINPKTGHRKFVERELEEGELQKLMAETM
jgi:thiol-disulfide isomerase/thioredoxin